MKKVTLALCGVFILLASLTSFAQLQPGAANPAVTDVQLTPAPVAGLGSTLQVRFRIGNFGTADITGVRDNIFSETIQLQVCLSKCVPDAANPLDAFTGIPKDWFDLTYTPSPNPNDGGCFNGVQKADFNIPAFTLEDITINAKVTRLSISPFVNDIGAYCRIVPNANATLNGQPTDDDYNAVYTHSNALAQPVSLVSFTAQAQTDRTVLLKWQTSWEKANQAYFIERSKDLKSFETVGQVSDVAGSSSSLSSYRFVDSSPYRGTSYYRLRQVDVNGSSQTFKAESVVLEGRYGVYPNPVVGQQFTLELDEPASAVLRLYSASGRELELNRSGSGEASTLIKPADKLIGGVYILRVEERGTVRQHRLVVVE